MRALILAACLSAGAAHGQSLTAAQHLTAGHVIGPEDLAFAPDLAGGITEPGDAIGRETRIAIYQGRVIRAADLRNPTLVDRNQIVRVRYQAGGLTITAEARSLGRGGAGDEVRVMNIASRSTLTAMINPDGSLSALSNER
ncbi:MAG: flagellar basal body P-ring formation chaperone FlgA [Paracoccus sp. (in: a-proteobacteria)]|nr:flagellar basal body P-ring formation chaperone FlgA [Paracoccus sp. (in: a-proteobacteria)]